MSVPKTLDEFIRWADRSSAQTWAGKSGLKERLLHPERFKPDGTRVEY